MNNRNLEYKIRKEILETQKGAISLGKEQMLLWLSEEEKR